MRHKHWVRPLGQALPTPWPCFKSIYYTLGTRWLMRKCGASVSIGCDTRLAMASHGRPWPAMGKTEKAERPNVHQKSSKDRAVPKVVQSRPRALKWGPKGSLTVPEGFLQAPRRRPKASQGNPNVREGRPSWPMRRVMQCQYGPKASQTGSKGPKQAPNKIMNPNNPTRPDHVAHHRQQNPSVHMGPGFLQLFNGNIGSSLNKQAKQMNI